MIDGNENRRLASSDSRLAISAAWVISVAVPLLLNWQTTAELARRWSDLGAYSHGPLVVGMFVWLAYARLFSESNSQLFRVRSSQLGLAAAVVLSISFAMAWFQSARFEVAAEALIPLIIAAAGYCFFALRIATRLGVAALLLFFTVPIWDPLHEPLRLATTWVATSITEIAGWPAEIVGSTIYFPTGVIEIAEGCSGLKYFVAATCLGAFSSLLAERNLGQMIVVLGAYAATAIIGNWIRVTALVGIGYHSEMQSSLMESHNFFGWVVFTVLLLPVLWVVESKASGRPADQRGSSDVQR